MNFGSDEYTEISLVWNQLIISSCFEACGVQRFHLQEVCARDQFCILPRMKKLWLLYVYMWVTSESQVYGSHLDCSVGQMGQQVWPTSVAMFVSHDFDHMINIFSDKEKSNPSHPWDIKFNLAWPYDVIKIKYIATSCGRL